jgi:hypothetical protein
MSSLYGAITLVQVNDISMVVSEKLDLDVLGFVEKTLNKDGSIAKSRLGLGSGSLEGVFQAFLFPHDSHTTSTTSVSCLDDDGKAVFVCEFLDILEFVNRSFCTRYNRNSSLDGNSSGRDFVAKCIDDLGRGADKLKVRGISCGSYLSDIRAKGNTNNKSGLLNIPSKSGVLRKESITCPES